MCVMRGVLMEGLWRQMLIWGRCCGSNDVPAQKEMCCPNPSPCECNFIWKYGLCRHNNVEMPSCESTLIQHDL